MDSTRAEALRALQQSLMTGELNASQRLGAVLAPDVTLTYGPDEKSGQAEVLARLSGVWAATWAFRHLVWSAPVEDGDHVRVEGAIINKAAWAPRGMKLDVGFNSAGQIASVVVEPLREPPGAPESVIPAVARAVINNARVTEHPMCIAYVNADGAPVQTFRGSIQVFSDTQLCAWIRNPGGSLATSIAINPRVSVTYQDSPDFHLFINGTARIDSSDDVRKAVFDMSPEVEQLHDPAMNGTALIIDVASIMGWFPGQWIMMRADA